MDVENAGVVGNNHLTVFHLQVFPSSLAVKKKPELVEAPASAPAFQRGENERCLRAKVPHQTGALFENFPNYALSCSNVLGS
jgi:hypothetical protein